MEDIKEKEPSNGKPHLEKEQLPPEPEQPPKDFKVAEIWIKDGRVCLDASMEFWSDRVRAVGLLDFCKDIVKTAKAPEEKKPDIVIPQKGSPLNFIRNRLKGKK